MIDSTPFIVFAVLAILSGLTAWIIFRKDLLVSWGKVTLGLGVMTSLVLVGLFFIEIRNYSIVDDNQQIFIVNTNRAVDGQYLVEFVNHSGSTQSIKLAGTSWQLYVKRMKFGPILSWVDDAFYYRLDRVGAYEKGQSTNAAISIFPISVVSRVINIFDAMTLNLFFQTEEIILTQVPLVDGALIRINQLDANTLVIEPINDIASKHLSRN